MAKLPDGRARRALVIGISRCKNAAPSRAQPAIEAIAPDRALLKLLASRPSEQSFEDERWDGGHGVFSYALLRGLSGAADREPDGIVTVSELTDYVSKIVPEQTGSLQNPRVAGNFEARVPLAMTKLSPAAAPSEMVALTLRGMPGAAIYVDDEYRGTIRPTGDLRIERIPSGSHRIAVDTAEGDSFEYAVSLAAPQSNVDLARLPEYALARLARLVREGRVLGPGGAFEQYQALPAAAKAQAETILAGALEDIGQECVNDYVQSSAGGLKRVMLLRAADAFSKLKTFRPNDASLTMKEKFCQGRAEIAAGQFSAAVESLRASLAIDPEFACSHNALGVALSRLNQPKEARAAFEAAARLAPEWFLPLFQIAQQLVNAGNVKGAIPYLERAVHTSPKFVTSRWNLMRAYRVVGRYQDVESQAQEIIALDANYAPVYAELAAHYEATREFARAAQAADTYSLLAPNFTDSAQMRALATRAREQAAKKAAPQGPPTLLRPGEKIRK